MRFLLLKEVRGINVRQIEWEGFGKLVSSVRNGRVAEE